MYDFWDVEDQKWGEKFRELRGSLFANAQCGPIWDMFETIKRMKLKYLFALWAMFATANASFSQSPGTINIGAHFMVQKFIAVAGNKFVGYGNDNSTGKYVIAQWDANFQEQWAFTFPVADVGLLQQIIELNDGNYAIQFADNSGYAIGVIKISTTGQILFVKGYRFTFGAIISLGFAPALPGDNGYIIGGGQCQYENYLIKCRADGTVEWANTYVSSTVFGGISVFGIVNTPSGYTMVSQYPNGAHTNIGLWQVDQSGIVQWSKIVHDDHGIQYPRKLLRTSNGDYVVMTTEGQTIGEDYLVFANASVTLASIVAYTTPNDFTFNDVALDASDMPVVVGTTSISMFNTRMVCFKASNAGQVLWQKSTRIAADATSSYPNDIDYAPSGNLAIAAGAPGPNMLGTISVIDQQGNGFCVDDPITITGTPIDSVYLNNDKRALIKRRINELLNSGLVEEKQYTSYSS